MPLYPLRTKMTLVKPKSIPIGIPLVDQILSWPTDDLDLLVKWWVNQERHLPRQLGDRLLELSIAEKVGKRFIRNKHMINAGEYHDMLEKVATRRELEMKNKLKEERK